MKRILMLFFLAVGMTAGKAEDVIQVVPFETTAGVTTDDMQNFSIEMRNSEKMLAFQFDILLPEGMSLDNTDGLDPFEFNEDRVSYTVDRRGNKTFDYLAEYSDPFDGGWITVMVFTLEAKGELKGLDGEIMRVYYLTDENMKPGVYPVRIRNTVLANADNTKKFKPVESTSYITIGESPLKTEQTVSMSSLTGYVPSFTVEQMNSQMEGNKVMTSLDLSSADSLGAVPVMGNKNGLVRVSATAATSTLADAKNVVVATADGDVCNSLSLADGDWNFNASEGFTAKNAAFNRVFKAGQWSTVCLPYGVSAEQLSVIKESGVEVERLTSYDADANILKFEAVTEMVANTPYIIKCCKETAPFEALADVAVAASATLNDVHCGIATMSGVLSTTILNSDASTSYYGYNSADGSFVKIGSNGTAYPFRAFISIPSTGAEVKRIGVEHGNGELTGVTEVDDTNATSAVDVYTVDGKLVRSSVSAGEATKGLVSGVYVVGSKKIVVR